MANEITIGDLARAADTKIETVRYYERIGLMPAPQRTRGNYRSYTAEHLERLSFIRRSRELGFSVEQVRQLLSLSDDRNRPCDLVDEMAREHLAAIDRKLSNLKALRRELDTLIRQCRHGVIAECNVIRSLASR
jgi:DNA-binding transcriptional MerR regulator